MILKRIYQLVCINFFIILVSNQALADFNYDFIRISCIKENQFLNIDYAPIHNTPVDLHRWAPENKSKNRFLIWSKHGYFSPRKLSYECKFDPSENTLLSTYRIETEQAESSNGMCGGAPEIIFSLYKNNEVLIDKVVFGGSCYGAPSISHIYLHGNTQGNQAEEMEICFRDNSGHGSPLPADKCEWNFLGLSKKNAFPINNKSIRDYIGSQNKK